MASLAAAGDGPLLCETPAGPLGATAGLPSSAGSTVGQANRGAAGAGHLFRGVR